MLQITDDARMYGLNRDQRHGEMYPVEEAIMTLWDQGLSAEAIMAQGYKPNTVGRAIGIFHVGDGYRLWEEDCKRGSQMLADAINARFTFGPAT